MAQENPEKFPTGDTAARDEEADQISAAVSPEDRSLLTRGFARAIAMGDTFAPDFSLFHQTILNDSVCLIQSGGVVKLTDYAPLYFHYKNYQQINNVVLLNNFSISDLPVWNIPPELVPMIYL